MEHVVFFPAPDGTPAFRRLAGLDEAVRLVEHLRNVEGVSAVSVHALAEVPLAFRAYYRVEVPGLLDAVPAGQVPAQPGAPAGDTAGDLPGDRTGDRTDDLAGDGSGDLAGVLPGAFPAAAGPAGATSADERPEPLRAAGNGHALAAGLGFFA